jgi:hypothetical protein
MPQPLFDCLFTGSLGPPAQTAPATVADTTLKPMMSKLHMIRHQRRRRAYLQEVDRGSTPFATGILRALLEVAQRKGVATQCRHELKSLGAGGPVPEPGSDGLSAAARSSGRSRAAGSSAGQSLRGGMSSKPGALMTGEGRYRVGARPAMAGRVGGVIRRGP